MIFFLESFFYKIVNMISRNESLESGSEIHGRMPKEGKKHASIKHSTFISLLKPQAVKLMARLA